MVTEFHTHPRYFFNRHNPEHHSNRDPKLNFVSMDEIMKKPLPAARKSEFDPMAVPFLPYGVWTYSNGDEILFNRSYKAIWARLINSSGDMVECYMAPKLSHESAFMRGKGVNQKRVSEEWFRDDANFNPRRKLVHVARCRQIVATFITGGSIRDYIIN